MKKYIVTILVIILLLTTNTVVNSDCNTVYGEMVQNKGENIAYGRTVTASSEESEDYAASKAVDADGTTRWASAFEDNQNLIIDLWDYHTISSIKITWEAAYAAQYQIQVSNDNKAWSTVYENYSATGGTQTINFNPVSARYIKLYCIKRATEYGFSVYEIEIYETKNSVNSSAASAKDKVLEYLYSIQGKQTIIGMHNREPNSEPAKQTNQVYSITGQYPALWSGDFLFSSSDVANRWNMIYECKQQWENGSIVQLMLHVTPPTQSEEGNWEGGVVSSLSNEQWSSLIAEGGELNRAWKKRLDTYAVYLQYLKDNGVPVLFRPFHEMNQGIFWWAGRKGSTGTAALYRMTRDYLENEKGLDNIIWVWDVQDLSYDWSEYNPGNNYWDIFAVDVYNSDYFTSYKYNQALSVAGDKLIAIGECDKLPTADRLKEQPRWSFVMSWSELTFSHNTNNEIQNLYWAENVIVQNELPNLKGETADEPQIVISDSVNVMGYQISTTLGGSRVVSSIEPIINGKTVEKNGFVYALVQKGDTVTDVSDSDMIVDSKSGFVATAESTDKGFAADIKGKTQTAKCHVMTTLFKDNTAEEFLTKYKVRAYAMLSDGSYVYSNIYAYRIYDIASALYDGRKLSTNAGHTYLYNNILGVVNPGYKKVNYEWSNIVAGL